MQGEFAECWYSKSLNIESGVQLRKLVMIATSFLSIVLSSGVLGQFERVSLDEKVRCSELVVIGTVTSVSDETRVFDALDPAASAKKVAQVHVDKVLKGNARGETLHVGADSDTKDDMARGVSASRSRILLAVGNQYIFFLRRTPAHYLACVNWKYGALEVVDGEVENPERPAEDVSSLFWSNSECLPLETSYEASAFQRNISLDLAVGLVERAITLAERQRHVCDINLGDEPAQVFWERNLFDERLVVRYMNRLACAPVDFTVSAVEGKRARELPGSIRAAPDSVDPLGGTIDVGYVISRDASAGGDDQLILSHMESRAVFAQKDGRLLESSLKTRNTQCPICKSRQSVRITYGYMVGDWLADGCMRSRRDLYRWGGCMDSENDRACKACGVEWSTSNP